MGRKHRLVIDITLSRDCSEKEAKQALEVYLSRIDFDASPALVHTRREMYADKVTVKQFSRVAASL